MAAILIIGETWRSSRSQTKRRDSVNDQLEDLGESVQQLKQNFEGFTKAYEERLEEEAARYVVYTPLYGVTTITHWGGTDITRSSAS